MAIQNESATAPAGGNLLTPVSLRDEEVSLGPVLPNDLGPMFIWFNDAETAKLDLAWRPVDANSFKCLIENIGKDMTQVMFAIRKVREPQIIGFVLLRNLQLAYRSAELGIRIGAESERGKGYGGRALALALDYAWNSLNLHRVGLTVFANNPRAIATYRAAGFLEEGVMRQAAYIDGKWVDVVVMGALRSDAVKPN